MYLARLTGLVLDVSETLTLSHCNPVTVRLSLPIIVLRRHAEVELLKNLVFWPAVYKGQKKGWGGSAVGRASRAGAGGGGGGINQGGGGGQGEAVKRGQSSGGGQRACMNKHMKHIHKTKSGKGFFSRV